MRETLKDYYFYDCTWLKKDHHKFVALLDLYMDFDGHYKGRTIAHHLKYKDECDTMSECVVDMHDITHRAIHLLEFMHGRRVLNRFQIADIYMELQMALSSDKPIYTQNARERVYGYYLRFNPNNIPTKAKQEYSKLLLEFRNMEKELRLDIDNDHNITYSYTCPIK